MRAWPVQDAKAKLSEKLEACFEEGPKLLTLHGSGPALLVPIEQWRHLKGAPVPTLKDLLLAEQGRGELNLPARGKREAA